MRYVYKTSFDKAYRRLHPDGQSEIDYALQSLFDFLDKKTPLSVGLGFKRIGKAYWEIRAGIRCRILFEWTREVVTFYFVGNHDQIRRFIRHEG